MSVKTAVPDIVPLIEALKAAGSSRNVEGMARYGIRPAKVFGVPLSIMRSMIREEGLKRDHALAAALWESGWHETRMLAVLLAEPKRVDGAQMEAWAAQFDSWAICDGACIHLFRRAPLAWEKTLEWCGREREYVKRAGFALAATLAVNAKNEPDSRFLPLLEAVEREADDPRNFVKKAVNWALRSIGKRSLELNSLAIASANRIAGQGGLSARGVANGALRELTGREVQERLGSRR